MAVGRKVSLGTFLINGEKQLIPTRPWTNTVVHTSESGNVTDCSSLSTCEFSFADTDSDSSYNIPWVEVYVNEKLYYICDRILAYNFDKSNIHDITYSMIKEGVYTAADYVMIDGKYFIPFLFDDTTNADEYIFVDYPTISVEINFSGDYVEPIIEGYDPEIMIMYGEIGATDAGEYEIYFALKDPSKYAWNTGEPLGNNFGESIVCNGDGIQGLPYPDDYDFDDFLTQGDIVRDHNKFWNWVEATTYCADGARGGIGVNAFFEDTEMSGYRPCLLRVGDDPTLNTEWMLQADEERVSTPVHLNKLWRRDIDPLKNRVKKDNSMVNSLNISYGHGHRIYDRDNKLFPQRRNLQFMKVKVWNDVENNVTFIDADGVKFDVPKIQVQIPTIKNREYNSLSQSPIITSMSDAGIGEGKVEGDVRFTVQWNDTDTFSGNDLDIHCIEPNGNKIYFGSKVSSTTQGTLNIDTRTPVQGVPAVENITWQDRSTMIPGDYQLFVRCWSYANGDDGFRAEVEFDGKIYGFNYSEIMTAGKEVFVGAITVANDRQTLSFIPDLPTIGGDNYNYSYDPELVEVSEDVWATDPGIYRIRFSLKDPTHYEWSDGTIADIVMEWRITGSLPEPEPEPVIPISEYTKEQALEYLGTIDTSWSNASDENIVHMVEWGKKGYIDLADYWSVGDERRIGIRVTIDSATGLAEEQSSLAPTFVLMHAGLYDLVTPVLDKNGNRRTKVSFVCGMKNSFHYRGRMNTENTNSYGWLDSLRRQWCNEELYNAIPENIRSIFAKFKTYTAIAYTNNTNCAVTEDYFALPAAKEVFGGATATTAGTQTLNTTLAEFNRLTQFDYYAQSANNRLKTLGDGGGGANASYAMKQPWWLRSPDITSSSTFACVLGSGEKGANNASEQLGLSPFGCIN